MNKRQVFFFLTAIAGLMGCSGKDAVICDEKAVAGLNVYVYDAVTLYPVIQQVIVQAHSSGDVELLNNPVSDGSPFFGAFEKPGDFTIIVSHPEYRPDTLTVTVEQGRCHVKPEVLYSRLRKF